MVLIRLYGGAALREIKTKPEGGKPKLLERAARMPKAAMKDAWLKAKEKTVSEYKETPFSSQQGESSNAPANSAGEQMVSGIETAVKKGADTAGRAGKTVTRTAVRKVKETRGTARAVKNLQESGNTIGEAARLPAAPGKIRTKTSASRAVKGKPVKSVKTAGHSLKGIKQGAKDIKTAQQTAKAAQKTAQTAVKASQRTIQAARAAARVTAAGLKAAVKAAVAATKAAVAGTKALIAAIAAGGWVAVVILLLICLIAMIVGSVFGIFLPGGDTGGGITLQSAVQELDIAYEGKLEEIRDSCRYDVLEMNGSRAAWKDVAAVYAVRTPERKQPSRPSAWMRGKRPCWPPFLGGQSHRPSDGRTGGNRNLRHRG